MGPTSRAEMAVSGVLLALLISGCSTTNEATAEFGSGLPSAGGARTLDTAEEEQAAALEQERLDYLWSEVVSMYPDADRPSEVMAIRTVTDSEWAETQTRCLQDAGYAAERMRDGGLSFARIPVQDQDFHVARYSCEARFPPDPVSLLPPSDADLESIYAYQTGSLTDCLEREGFAVPDPPSVETFIEQQRSGAAVGWSPYAEISQNVGEDEWLRLNELCPQDPTD